MEPRRNVQQAVPFFAVSNMEESLCYDVTGLGFEMTGKWIDEGKLRWCWLQIGDAAVMVREFRKEGHDSRVPRGQAGKGVTICPSDLPGGNLARDHGLETLRRERNVGDVPPGPRRLPPRRGTERGSDPGARREVPGFSLEGPKSRAYLPAAGGYTFRVVR